MHARVSYKLLNFGNRIVKAIGLAVYFLVRVLEFLELLAVFIDDCVETRQVFAILESTRDGWFKHLLN